MKGKVLVLLLLMSEVAYGMVGFGAEAHHEEVEEKESSGLDNFLTLLSEDSADTIVIAQGTHSCDETTARLKQYPDIIDAVLNRPQAPVFGEASPEKGISIYLCDERFIDAGGKAPLGIRELPGLGEKGASCYTLGNITFKISSFVIDEESIDRVAVPLKDFMERGVSLLFMDSRAESKRFDIKSSLIEKVGEDLVERNFVVYDTSE